MLVDANLLVYAHDAEQPFHDEASTWLEDQLNGPRRVDIPWPSVLAFLRLTPTRAWPTGR
jgi:predicted nucleic acid-binding protein